MNKQEKALEKEARADMIEQIEFLASHHRGRVVLKRLVDLMCNPDGARELDTVGRKCLLNIIGHVYGRFAGSSIEEIKTATKPYASALEPTFKELTDMLCDNQAAWEDEEESVKDEHADLIADNSVMLTRLGK